MGLIAYFRILEVLIILFFYYVANQNGKVLEEALSSRFQFRCCENNIETSTLLQNDPPFFASSSKISSHSSVPLSLTIESITNGLGKKRHIQIGKLPVQST